jgi:hypothetical protein
MELVKYFDWIPLKNLKAVTNWNIFIEKILDLELTP